MQTEKYPVKPMFVDEAVLQMEMSARQFVVFLNAKTERSTYFIAAKRGLRSDPADVPLSEIHRLTVKTPSLGAFDSSFRRH